MNSQTKAQAAPRLCFFQILEKAQGKRNREKARSDVSAPQTIAIIREAETSPIHDSLLPIT